MQVMRALRFFSFVQVLGTHPRKERGCNQLTWTFHDRRLVLASFFGGWCQLGANVTRKSHQPSVLLYDTAFRQTSPQKQTAACVFKHKSEFWSRYLSNFRLYGCTDFFAFPVIIVDDGIDMVNM